MILTSTTKDYMENRQRGQLDQQENLLPAQSWDVDKSAFVASRFQDLRLGQVVIVEKD